MFGVFILIVKKYILCMSVDLLPSLFAMLPDQPLILSVCIWYGFSIFLRRFGVKPQGNVPHCPPLVGTCPKTRKNSAADALC